MTLADLLDQQPGALVARWRARSPLAEPTSHEPALVAALARALRPPREPPAGHPAAAAAHGAVRHGQGAAADAVARELAALHEALLAWAAEQGVAVGAAHAGRLARLFAAATSAALAPFLAPDEAAPVDAARESEERLRALLESTAEGLWGLDAEGRCTFANAATVRLLGYDSAEELLGRNMHALTHHHHADGTPYPAHACRIYEAFVTGREVVADDEVVWRRDGQPLRVRYRASPLVRQGRVVGAVVAFEDVGEKQRAEAARREAERRYQRLASTGIVGICEWERSGAITGANDTFLAMLGYTRADLEAGRLDFRRLTPPEHQAATDRALRSLAERGVVLPFEKQYVRKDGARVDVFLSSATLDEARTRGIALALDITERKRAEAALRQSQQQLRLVVDSLPFLLTFVDAEHRYALTNRAYRAWWGVEPEALVGRSVREVVGEENYRRARPRMERALAGEVVEFEQDYFFRDGRHGFVQATYVPYRGEDGRVQGFVGLVRDVSGQKQLEAALRASEERLRRVLEVTEAGTFDIDVTTGRADVDARMRAITGLPAEGPVDTTATMGRVHPADRPAMEAAFQRCLRDGTPYVVEHRIVHGEGEPERWVSSRAGALFDAQGRAVRFVGTVVDVTEQKRARQELELVFQHSADMMGMATPDGFFRRVNPAFVRTLGWSEAQLAVMPFLELVHPDDVERTRAEFQRLLGGGASTLHFENRYRRADGAWRWLAWAAAPLSDGSLVYCTARDVTEEKGRALFEQQLLGIASHDLRNPLQAILLSAHGLAQREDADVRTLRAAARIRAAADRAQRLVGDLLDFTQARLGGGIQVVRRALDLHALVRGVVDEVEAAWPERDVRFTCEGDGQGAWDGDRIAQVAENLLTNALKYGAAEAPVAVSTRGEGAHVVLEVHNAGDPLPPELLPRLFEPLQRAGAALDRQSRSVGLGLYIVKHLVEAHGGSVAVTSGAEHGTRFTVRLPREAPGP